MLQAGQARSGAGEGETGMFMRLYRDHAEAVLVFFARRTFDVESARDLTAETFAQAFEHRGRFRGSTEEQAAAWLYGIARHQLSHFLRRGAVRRRALAQLGIEVPAPVEGELERIVELAGLSHVRERVASAMAELHGHERRALELRVVLERPYSEVATALGVSEQAARARVSRALRHLANAIELSTAAGLSP